MVYGVASKFLRIPDSKFKYRGNYVYVDDGFFDICFFRPIPLGFLTVIGHVLWVFAMYRLLTGQLWISLMFNFWYGTWGGLAMTAGSHRLWCHRSFEAKLPLKIFLMLGHSMIGETSLYLWSIGHRVHHKYSDTDADPHNTKRGFFFAHMGWAFKKEHPDVTTKERLYDYSDLQQDAVVMFQHKYYYYLFPLMTLVLPMALQILLIGDTLLDAFLSVVLRNLVTYHVAGFVNSTAHMFGERPYNKDIEPAENYWVSLTGFGEGYHNYHHSFPWDYKAGEYSAGFNLTTIFLDGMHAIGQAYNMRTASEEVVQGSKSKTEAASVYKTVAKYAPH